MQNSRKSHPIKIYRPWCKNCGICKEFCPRKVFELREGEITVANPQNCTLCGMCQLRCPDFAIELEDDPDEPRTP